MRIHLIRWLTIAALQITAASSWACSIVYGKDWAFLADAPPGWSSACHTQALQGTVITLWPTAQRRDASDSLIYVTVSGKQGLPSLREFAADAIARFKVSAPSVRVSTLEVSEVASSVNMELVAFSGAPPGSREELVAYIEGPTAYFIAVLTAPSTQVLAERRSGFIAFVSRFSPMERQ